MTALDLHYVAARRVLLDALEALAEHRTSVVLVGAQAVYLRSGEADFDVSVAPFTTDADLTIDPTRIAETPQIAEAMRAAGFELKIKVGGEVEPGTWIAKTDVDGESVAVPVDLLVPEALAPSEKGRRDARLPAHGRNATRWTPGLEATILDNTSMAIESLEPGDARCRDRPQAAARRSQEAGHRTGEGPARAGHRSLRRRVEAAG